jgi:hypothetical protein
MPFGNVNSFSADVTEEVITFILQPAKHRVRMKSPV